ncbi:unnamed protein product [Rhizophagus irregularis]|nr:unnamed protein product [Rhizophagus irregularis]
MVNWQAFRRRVLRERKIKRDLCKLREVHWISSISAELLSTQTLEYWLLSYVSETASSDAKFWCEFISPRDWLLCCFDINIETAIAIVSGVSEDYLEQQTPRYWVENWIKQLANRPSSEFNSFINNANLNELINYEHALHPTPIHVVNKEPVNGDDNELRLLLQTELGQQADESTLFYHTTNLWC